MASEEQKMRMAELSADQLRFAEKIGEALDTALFAIAFAAGEIGIERSMIEMASVEMRVGGMLLCCASLNEGVRSLGIPTDHAMDADELRTICAKKGN